MKLESNVEILSGFAFKSNLFNTEGLGIPLIRIRDVTSNSVSTYFNGEYKDDFIVENGDLLVGMDGQFNLIEWKGGKALLNQRVCKIIPDLNKIDKNYIKYLVPKALKEIEDKTSFVTVKHLTVKKIKDIILPKVSLETQKRIARILDDAAALRDKTAQLIKEYDALAQSIFLDMFGDPVRNEKGWEVKTLKEVCRKITDGTHDTPQRITEGIKFITGKHIRPFKIDYENSDYVTREVHQEIYKRCNPEFEDILYTNIGVNFGTAAMNTVDYEFSMKNVALLKYDRAVLTGRYLESLLNNENFKDRLKKVFGIGGAQQFLSLSNIKAVNILTPPITLQNQFAEKITLIEQQKELAKQELRESEDLFNCLLQKAFKGDVIARRDEGTTRQSVE